MKAKFKFSEYFVFPLSFTLFLPVLHLFKTTNKNYTMWCTLSSLTSSGKKAAFFLDRVMCCNSQYLHTFKILRHRWQQIIVRFGTRIIVCWKVVWVRMAPVGHYLWILPSPNGGWGGFGGVVLLEEAHPLILLVGPDVSAELFLLSGNSNKCNKFTFAPLSLCLCHIRLDSNPETVNPVKHVHRLPWSWCYTTAVGTRQMQMGWKMRWYKRMRWDEESNHDPH